MTDPSIRESVIAMLHHMSGIMRRGSVMLKVHRNPCSQRNILIVVLVIHFAESLGNFVLSYDPQDALRRTTCYVFTRVAKCTDVDGGIFEYLL